AGFLASDSAELNLDTSEETFSKDLTSFKDGFLVNFQLAYAPSKNHTITLGYRKDFQDAVFTNYVAYNYGFARYSGLFFNHLGLGGEFDVRSDAYHGEVHRDDLDLSVKGQLAYKFTSYLDAAVSGGWNERACGDKDCDGIFYATEYDD